MQQLDRNLNLPHLNKQYRNKIMKNEILYTNKFSPINKFPKGNFKKAGVKLT